MFGSSTVPELTGFPKACVLPTPIPSGLCLRQSHAVHGLNDSRLVVAQRRMQAPEPEVGRLERERENILEGVRKGYEHAHLLLRRTAPQHPTAGMDGREAALKVRSG